MADWMIYGANGYSGELIAREAARQGLRPILAGRNAKTVTALAAELNLPYRVFALDALDFSGVSLVLNCAGPFSATAKPVMAAALAAHAHYLDITGEIDVFEYAQSLDGEARAANIVLCPGVGFDVIPTDCLALALKQALPDATILNLGFQSHSLKSPGTAKTTVEGMGTGNRIRRGGVLKTEAIGVRTRRIDFGTGTRLAAAFPWGDVSTAYKTTGIPSITVFLAVAPSFRWAMLASNVLGPLLRLPAIRKRLMAGASAAVGPDETARQNAPTLLWGEVSNASGVTRTARIQTANGYDVTIHGALAVIRHIMEAKTLEPGFTTPALLCGIGLIEALPGSSKIELN
jgi:short subunit dehydrogenase-like uncharacterized protein